MLRIAFVLALVGCHHDAEPAKLPPGEVAPLPSASGTPIGFLLDERAKLHLTDDQVLQLRQIDTILAADLDKIDSRMRAVAKVSDPALQPSSSAGRGGRHGGGGMGGGGGGRHRGGGGSGSGAGGAHGKTDADRLSEQRAADVRDAIHHAFSTFDNDQIAAAKQVLSDHDVDLEDPEQPPSQPPQAPPLGSGAAPDPDDDSNQP